MINSTFKNWPDTHVTEKDIDSLKVAEPVEFLSEKQNELILERIKYAMRSLNHPERWMSMEECVKQYTVKMLHSAFEELNVIYKLCKEHYEESYASKISKLLLSKSFSLSTFPFSYPIYYISDSFLFRKK